IQGLNYSKRSTDLYLLPVLKAEPLSSTSWETVLLKQSRNADWGQLRADVPRPPGDVTRLQESPERYLHYLEGRILQREGKHLQAVEKLGRVVRLDPNRPEPFLCLADSLKASGEPGAAEARLREALQGGPGGAPATRKLWESWVALSLVDLKRTPSEILAAFPARLPAVRAARPRALPAGSSGSGKDAAYGEDVHWALERLSSGEPIRIRCGGGEYRSAAGVLWGKDRFYNTGHTSEERPKQALGLLDVSGTEDDPLYLGGRYFKAGDLERPGYRVPLPPGRYRVTLHFAEVVHREPAARRFGVRLEAKPVLDGFEPAAAGFAVAQKRAFQAPVEDGFLEIEFVRETENPRVAGIEIERIDS
ncbi:MAG: malectin domain-containing carbohydrate-binding protein, partial [Thermoanaerobaculia bacterium]